MRNQLRPVLQTLLGLAVLAGVVTVTMRFVTGTLNLSDAYWLVPIFGALGGVVGGVLRNEGKLLLCVLEESSSIRLGILGDMVLGLGGASAITFIFGGTLHLNPKEPDSTLLFISISSLAGIFGRNVVEAAGERLLRQAREAAKQETRALMGTPAAVAYTYAAMDTTRQGYFEKAIELAELALQNDPKHVNAYIEKGRALKRLGKIEAALTAVERGLELELENPKLLYNRACYKCLLKRGLPEVLPDLKKALSMSPKLRETASSDDDLRQISDMAEFKRLVAGEA